MNLLKEGDKAPDFLQHTDTIQAESIEGKKIILYFYPKDNTPGCTAEACNLRDNYEYLQQEGFEVIGISPDKDTTHERFAAKHELPFRLIADVDKKIMNQFGVWGEKKLYGRVYDGVHRTTFIINDGIIEKVIPKVKTKDHAQQIFDLYEVKPTHVRAIK